MYEYVDGRGERVTVRSARTLGFLLGDGRITGTTKFRRAEEPIFVPAASHEELRRIAAEVGLQFEPASEPAPAAPVAPKPILPLTLDDLAPPVTPESKVAALAAPERKRNRKSASGTGPWLPGSSSNVQSAQHSRSTAPPPSRPASAPMIIFTPAKSPLEDESAGVLRRIGISLLHHGAAAICAGAASIVAMVLSGSRLLAFLVLVGTAIAVAGLAGRRMGRQKLATPNWEVIAGGILSGAIVCAVAGWVGFLLSGLIGLVVWRKLKMQLQLSPSA